MSRLTLVLIAALASLTISTAHAQTCTEPHYRWSEKIDTSFAHQTPTDVDVSGMLTWTPHTITAKDKCAKRIGREKNVYAVTAYVRRIKLRESDGDWHIEITEEESTPVPASCVIVEIPARPERAGPGDLHWRRVLRRLSPEDDSRGQAREPARPLQFVGPRCGSFILSTKSKRPSARKRAFHSSPPYEPAPYPRP